MKTRELTNEREIYCFIIIFVMHLHAVDMRHTKKISIDGIELTFTAIVMYIQKLPSHGIGQF